MAKKRKKRKAAAAPARRRPQKRRAPYRARRNPPKRRYRRRRSNPLVPTSLLQRGLAIAAGFLAAPRIAAMVPIDLPGGRLGQYAKEFIVISVGSQVVTKALGRKYGQALFAGGVIHIAVDMLQSYVTPFAAPGVGAYFPPNDQLALTYGDAAGCLPGGDLYASGNVGRLSSRFN